MVKSINVEDGINKDRVVKSIIKSTRRGDFCKINVEEGEI